MVKDDKMRKALSAYVTKARGFYNEKDMDEFMSKCKLNTRALECSATGRVNKSFYICEQTVFMKDKSKAEAGDYLCVCADCYDVLTIAIPDYLAE